MSPHSSQPLKQDSTFSLTDGEHRYPIIDSIPYLRTGRELLSKTLLELLAGDHPDEALCLLLQDRDDWWRGGIPSCSELTQLIGGTLSLREAMQALQFGAVGDYFAYRWSDPTFLSGLALLQAHLPAGATVLEVACGIGHYLREFEMRGIAAMGMDVVFAKLWLARNYVSQSTPLVCCDAGTGLPVKNGAVNTVFCHDAFYFLPYKTAVVAEMRRVCGPNGRILIGHTHCAEANNFSAGQSVSMREYVALFPGATMYEDAELTASVIANRKPQPGTGAGCQAVALASGAGGGDCLLTMPMPGIPLTINPWLSRDTGLPIWPSQRYSDEYAGLSTYLNAGKIPEEPDNDSIRRRIFLALPNRW